MIALAGLFISPVIAYAAHEDVVLDHGQTLASLDALLDHLESLEELNERYSSKFSRSRIDEHIQSMRAELRKVRRVLRKAPAVATASPEAPSNARTAETAPMAPTAFAELVEEVKDASFSTDKIARIRSACEFHQFTSSQVVQIVNVMSFGKDKVEAAVLMHSRVVDPDSFYKVFKHLDFKGDRQDLRRRIDAR